MPVPESLAPIVLREIDASGDRTSTVLRRSQSPDLIVDPMLDRFDLVFLIRKYWRRLLALPVIGCVVATVLVFIQQPLFESTAVILVDPSYDKIIQYENVDDGHRSDMEALKSLEVAIMTDSVLLRLMDRLDLKSQEGFLPESLTVSGISDLKILKYLRENRISATLLPETRLIQIDVLDPDPRRAQQIASALSVEFEAFLGEQRRKEVENVRDRLAAQAEQAKLAALASEESLKAFRNSHPHFPVEQDHQLFSNRLTEFGQQLNATTGRRIELESQQKALEKLDPVVSPMEIVKVADYNEMAHVSALLDSLTAARTNLSVAEEQYTESHPQFRMARAGVSRIESELRELARNIKAAVNANYLSEKSREEILTEEVDEAKAEFVEMKTFSSEFRALLQQTERDWSVHQALQGKLSENSVSTEITSQIATVVSEPMVPYKKAKPSLLLYLFLGGFAGSMASGGVLVWVILAGLPFSSRLQLEQRFGLPVIADWSASKKKPDPAKSTALLQYLGGSRDKTIQISAPQLNGIGESVAYQVAFAAAQNGQRTLLIIIKPGDTDLKVRPTDLQDHLFFLQVTPDLVRDQERFRSGLRQLKRDFDNLFIEAGGAEDPELVSFLSSFADQDIVVVGKDRSSKHVVDERIARLSRPGCSSQVALMLVNAG